MKRIAALVASFLCVLFLMSCKGLDGNNNLPDSVVEKEKTTVTKYDFLKQNKNVSLPEEFPGEGWYIIVYNDWTNETDFESRKAEAVAVYVDENEKCLYEIIGIFTSCMEEYRIPEGHFDYSGLLKTYATGKELYSTVYWVKVTEGFYEAHKDVLPNVFASNPM